MTNRSKSIKNLLFASMGQIIIIVVGLILPRLYMVEYGSEVNGLLNSLNQFLVCLSLLEAGIGVTTLQALYEPVARQDWSTINTVLATTDYYYRRTSFWYLVLLVLLSVVYPFVARSELPYALIVGAVFFSGVGNVFLFRFQGKFTLFLQVDGKNYVLSNLSTIFGVATNLLKAVLISAGWNIVFILAAAFLLQMLQTIYILHYIKAHYRNISLKVKPDLKMLAQRKYTLIHQISGLIFQNTDVLILTVVCGLKIVSVYSMFKLVVTHLESVLNIVSNSLNFVLGQTFQTDREKYIRRIDLFESYYSAIAFALFSVALYLFLPFVELYTAGVTDVQYVDERLPGMFVAIALLTVLRTPMIYTINYAGHFRQTTLQSIMESVINLTVSVIGVYWFGICGVLAGTIVALLYRSNDIIIYANKKILNRKPLRTYQIHLVNIGIFAITQALFRRLFGVPSTYGELLVVGGVATLVAMIIFFLGQSLLMPHCRRTIRNFVKRGEHDV